MRAKLKEVFSRYPADQRKSLLQELLILQTQAMECHHKLMQAENHQKFEIRETDYHELLELYLIIFRLLRKIPKSHTKSFYEMDLVNSFDTILRHHCEGEN
jgi:NADH:ubiquinone oxidoreductase subunit E